MPVNRPLRWVLPLAGLAMAGCAIAPAQPVYPGPVVYGGAYASAPVYVSTAPAYVYGGPMYYPPPPLFWGPPPPIYSLPPLWYGAGPPYVARPHGHYRPAPAAAAPAVSSGGRGSGLSGIVNDIRNKPRR